MRGETVRNWILHYELHEVEPYINWLYFFNAWGFPARYGNVAQIHDCTSCRAQWLASFPDDERPKAQEAMKLYDDALALLHQSDGKSQAHALVALFEACSEGEDVLIKQWQMANGQSARRDACIIKRSKKYQMTEDIRLPMLRQQHGDTCLCWADFLPPAESGQTETIGLFATSVDEDLAKGHDDYHRMLAQTLADRLAEATAERMHEEVRKSLWGYAKDEGLSIEQMFQEKYVGRRPAVGYPSLPDQSLNFLIDQLIGMKRIGVSLTESGAMRPHASTSGLIISHPQARHFAIGHIGEDQLKDYARRRGMSEDRMRPFLASNLT